VSCQTARAPIPGPLPPAAPPLALSAFTLPPPTLPRARERHRGRLDRQSFDAEYVRRLTDGDPDVERHFTAYFTDLLRLKLRSRLRSPELIQDARQETLLRVLTTLRCRSGLEHPERLGAFVNAVCNNVLLELYRSSARFRPMGEGLADQPDRARDPEMSLVSEDCRAHVQTVLKSLSQRDQEVLRMVFFEDAERADICQRLGIEEGYLRVLLHRAKTRFKAQLAERFPGANPTGSLTRASA
jgi:RNA polymerase sigma-70 factor (ECF subfamily)